MKEEMTGRERAERYRELQAETLIRIFEEFGHDPEAFAKALKANMNAEGKIVPLPSIK